MKKMHEALIIWMEECAEVTQSASKVIRFGLTDKNKVQLEKEIGDLMCMVGLLHDMDLIDDEVVQKQVELKREKLKKYSKLDL